MTLLVKVRKEEYGTFSLHKLNQERKKERERERKRKELRASGQNDILRKQLIDSNQIAFSVELRV